MSRLFDSFGGDDAAEAGFAVAAHTEVGASADILSDGESSLLSDDLVAIVEEPPTFEPMPEEQRTSVLLPHDYEIPDFERDAKDLAAYEDAQRRYIRQQIASAETAIQASFKAKREQLVREIKNGHTFEDERRAAALHTTRQYANAFPMHVDKKGISPPSFFENLFSFGRAGRLYRAASTATNALEALRNAMRKREEQLGALDSQMNRALYLKEESIKKTFDTEAGLAEFNRRPEVEPLFKRTEQIAREREEYARRLERGVVTDEEQRDRAMGEFKLTFAELPLMGAIIAKVARFGRLSYFQLRTLDKKESLLSYDPRLDSLRNSVFDVYVVAGVVAAKLKRNDNGTAFRVADHFKFCWRNQEQAEERYGQHRAALREDRGLPKMEPRDAAEMEILDRLAALAAMVDGGQARDQMPPAVSGAPTARP